MTVGVVGLEATESDEILNFLFDHCEQDAFVCKHQWTIGDLIVWDNRCSMHARTDFPGGEAGCSSVPLSKTRKPQRKRKNNEKS